jgi:hypothetical protein
MQTTTERRSNGATRLPLDALVCVGVGTENAFEAQAIDVSSHGMHLKTAYLPDVGQPMTCRFESGLKSIVAEGRVAWRTDGEGGGDFGLEFTELDEMSRAALTQMLRVTSPKTPGARVRLHIEGLGSPMRARVRESEGSRVTAFSELGFLKIGKGLELEDAASGQKRPAEIEQVDVELDPESKVPQLIVSMKYADDESAVDVETPVGPGKEATPEPSTLERQPSARRDSKLEGERAHSATHEFEDLKSPLSRSMAKVAPALLLFAGRAKAKAQELWKVRPEPVDASLPRRTTAPPPGGGVHTSGRRVVRPSRTSAGGTVFASSSAPPLASRANFISTDIFGKNKRRFAVGVAVVLAATTAFAMLRKGDSAKSAPTAVVTSAPDATSHMALSAAVAPVTAVMPVQTASIPLSMPAPVTVPVLVQQSQAVGVTPGAPPGESASAVDDSETESQHGKAQSFGHGNVSHGTVIHLKMDGNIERIQGAMQPTGFTVVIPKRRSLTSAGALSKQDRRIGQLKLTNDNNGSELNIAFKDGVPPYLVRAKKDVLEVVLGNASGGEEKAPEAKPDVKHGAHPAHKKHDTKHASHKKK